MSRISKCPLIRTKRNLYNYEKFQLSYSSADGSSLILPSDDDILRKVKDMGEDVMLTEEILKNLYQQEFSSCTSFEDISKRLAATQSEYVDDLRSMFCDELLYAVSMGYTTYDFKGGKSNVSAGRK